MANYSQPPDVTLASALSRGYHRVRFQQGKPVLDRELNLATDLASPRRLAAAYLGNGSPDATSLQVTGLNVPGNDFVVRAGRCLVDGIEVTLNADTTYRTQPHTTNVAPLPAGASNVYLRVFSREVSGGEDPTLGNPADVGFETSVREKADWEIVVSAPALSTPEHHLLAIIDTTAGTVQDRRRLGLSLVGAVDEVKAARGSTTTLAARLGTSLVASGALQAGIVGTAQLADGVVVGAKLANGAATIRKLASTLVFDADVAVAAATSASQPSVTTVSVTTADEPAFLTIGLRIVAPRPAAAIFFSTQVEWNQRVQLRRTLPAQPFVHLHQVVIRNAGTQALTVACRAYRLGEG
jgi:hypothetical protein